MTWLSSLESALAPIVTMAAVLIAIYAGRVHYSTESRKRTANLKAAAGLLEHHRIALDQVLSSPVVPIRMKENLLLFSDMASDRSASREFVDFICSPQKPSTAEVREAANAFRKDMNVIREKDQDVADAFMTAIGTAGVVAMIRWPETADAIDRYAQVMADSRKEAALFTLATRRRRVEKRRGDDSHLPGAAAPAY